MKYKVKDNKQIRIRLAPLVTSSAKGTLSENAVFFAETVSDDNLGLWVRILEGQYAGYFGAVRDAKGEVFADVVQDTTPNPTFPTSFTLDDGNGNKALYQFVRMVE